MSPTIICQHYLSGKCNRGSKCKFSHAIESGGAVNRKREGKQFRGRKFEPKFGKQEREEGEVGGEDAPICGEHGEKCMRRVGVNKNYGTYSYCEESKNSSDRKSVV